MIRHLLIAPCLASILSIPIAPRSPAPLPPTDPTELLYVDATRGDDHAVGTREHPLRSISAALEKVPDPLDHSVTILLAPSRCASTGGRHMPDGSLVLARRTLAGATIRIAGLAPEGPQPVLAWSGGEAMIDVREGSWCFEHVQIGAGESTQRRGIVASGTSEVALHDVRIALRSNSDAGILARRGGRITLRGAIRLNDPPPEGDESFCGVIATDHGVVEFDERKGSSLVLGNGSLSASYYGSIRLGCESASITCRTRSNCLSIGNGGRIDLRNADTKLVATDPKNTPIGLEDDGHILAEDAHILIHGENDSAIALQKASAFFCNDVELDGHFGFALWASSGSTFVGSFLHDVGRLEASTGAKICIERVQGKVVGPIEAKSGGIVALPDRVVGGR